MKKTKLTRSLLAACSIVALTAVMYGCVHDGGDEPATEPPVTEPMPDPEPPAPTDLEDTQAAAAAAATAAMTASDNAAAAATAAMTATAKLATLQTGEMGRSHYMKAKKYAGMAKTEADKAKKASDAAAAADSGADVEAAWRMAENAKDAAEAAAATAATASAAAIKAAKMELNVMGTMKWVDIVDADGNVTGMTSVDAAMGKLTTTADDGSVTITGHESDLMREGSGEVTGQPHSPPEATVVKPYKQAVEGRDLAIGKTLDTTDDKARLTVIHSRTGSKMVRVYVMEAVTDNFAIRTDSDGDKTRGTVSGGAFTAGTDAAAVDPGLKSVGMYYQAANTDVGTDGVRTTTDDAGTTDGAGDFSGLDHTDLVEADTKGKEIFSYLDLGDDNAVGGTGTAADMTRYVVEISRTVAGGNTDVAYQHVDTMAPAAPDTAADADAALDIVTVRAALPTAVKYSHIHFGVWAGLGAAKADGSQNLASLGIGFVQNFSGSGLAPAQTTGSATYRGDWVATVQRANATGGAGDITLDDGPATLVANFGTKKFTGTLTGLATLSGSIGGNGFSGTKATVAHGALDASGTFVGSFSGNIYGPAGDEAAGVFSFMGGEAGAFRGAFGGTSKQ